MDPVNYCTTSPQNIFLRYVQDKMVFSLQTWLAHLENRTAEEKYSPMYNKLIYDFLNQQLALSNITVGEVFDCAV